MNSKSCVPIAVLLFLIGGRFVSGQEGGVDSRWRFGLAYRPIFSVDVSFENRAASPAAISPLDADRSYADGFVGTDSTGNALDLTTYWGFTREEQWAEETLAMRHSQRGVLGTVEKLCANGLELVVGRDLGEGWNVLWGVEGALSYNHLDAEWRGTGGAKTLSLDAFPHGGIIRPEPPYDGPKTAGPGAPLLGATPTSFPLSVAGELEAGLYGFRLGPYLEFPIARCGSVLLGGGFSLAIVDSEVSFREAAPAPHAALGQSARGNRTDVVFGGYVSGQINITLGKGWEVFSGVQFHALSDFQHKLGDKVAKLDLGAAFAWTLGVNSRF
ncbi:MAG: hypothetical protein KIS67_23885 [Verrucomicrobiae bacterium]|nr:hypothetical protein [Verrucomicrobiae bacterium]